WLIARNPEKLAAAVKALAATSVQVNCTAADLTDPAAVRDVAQEISNTWDKINVLVNNAGMARFTNFAEVTADEMQVQVQLNLLTPFLLTQGLLPLLTNAKGAVI